MEENITFDYIREHGLLLYECYRGSFAQGLFREGISDYDTIGVYYEPMFWVDGLGYDYKDQISDEKGDTVWYSIRRFIQLLCQSNPNALEALFVDDDKVIYEHPSFKLLKTHRDMFLTKECLKTFVGYGQTQIKRASGKNKKSFNPMTERKDVLDFCHTFYKNGSIPMKEFLNKNGLLNKYCGVAKINNMRDMHCVFYDFAAHLNFEKVTISERNKLLDLYYWQCHGNDASLEDRIADRNFYGYKGIVDPEHPEESNELRLCSIPKGEEPVCYMDFNNDAYTDHCRKYREYKEWEAKRNPVRFEESMKHGQGYDAKNIACAIRLMQMGIEIATEGVIYVDRTNIDREFLLKVKSGAYTYEEVMKYLTDKNEEVKNAIESCKLPDTVNKDEANEILLKMRYFFHPQMID